MNFKEFKQSLGRIAEVKTISISKVYKLICRYVFSDMEIYGSVDNAPLVNGLNSMILKEEEKTQPRYQGPIKR